MEGPKKSKSLILKIYKEVLWCQVLILVTFWLRAFLRSRSRSGVFYDVSRLLIGELF